MNTGSFGSVDVLLSGWDGPRGRWPCEVDGREDGEGVLMTRWWWAVVERDELEDSGFPDSSQVMISQWDSVA